MRTWILLAAIAGCAAPTESSQYASEPPGEQVPLGYISIDRDSLETARAIDPGLTVVDADTEIAVVAFDPARLEALTEQMHEQHHRCGGFVWHDSLAEAEAVFHAQAGERVVDYTLDRAAVVEAVLPALDRVKIVQTIGELSTMPNRHYQSPAGAAASTWLAARWQAFTTRPDVTVELFDHGYAQRSVILTIPGTTSEIVVLGAHLDSITFRNGSRIAPGADDDASGIATLTEVARVLLAADYRPARTLKLIAYAAEEVGLRGSQQIVKDHQKRKLDVVGALQLDMTNYQGSEKDIWLMKDFTSAAQNAFMIELIETYVHATWGLDACGYACSDHAPWFRAGVPASFPFESRMRQHNPSIHTTQDTLEQSGNNAAHAIKFARLATAYAIELGKGELGPGHAMPTTSRVVTPRGPCTSSSWLVVGLLALGLVLAAAGVTRWLSCATTGRVINE
ncbi:MAG: M20/M25/M40 family metallo-hydrolase [Kofleriaceae bacterium]